jgi:hypothetical protein
MMEVFIASFYPSLSNRQPLPSLYALACFVLSIVPFLISNKRFAIIITAPLLSLLCLRAPCYTFGDPSSDYYNSATFMAIQLWYIDFVLLTPRKGHGAPAFIGGPGADKGKPLRWTNLSSMTERLRWAFRLMLPAHRGVGWDWQVKGVPEDPYVKFSRWKYVRVNVWWTAFYYVQSAIALIVLGFSYALREQSEAHEFWNIVVLNAVLGWSGAIWVWDRLNCAYSLAAALSVGMGLCDNWEWPPLMGPLKDAWSVRQMWR